MAHAGCAALEDIYGTKYVVGSPARVLCKSILQHIIICTLAKFMFRSH